MTELKKYIEEQINTLKELEILQYCTKEEANHIYHAKDDFTVDRWVRTLTERHWDEMMEDFDCDIETNISKDILAQKIIDSNLSLAIKNAILQCGVTDFNGLIKFITKNGLDKINVGPTRIIRIVKYMIPDASDEKVKNIVKNYSSID